MPIARRLTKDNLIFKSVRYEGEGQWSARLCILGKLHHLGYFRIPREARAAYRKGMKNHWDYLPQDYKASLIHGARFG